MGGGEAFGKDVFVTLQPEALPVHPFQHGEVRPCGIFW